ncbi:MAG: HAMP domain-containing histidine kinase, partial [Lachnospiraceae bacterium]|nr:HAMP domain-containing histidine kinase [Lachnospiraceae bacterium]
MKIFSLGFQFIVSYLVLAISILLLLNTYGNSVIYGHLIDSQETRLYEEATHIVSSYLSRSTDLQISGQALEQPFESIQILNNMRIWITDSSGTILIDSDTEKNQAGTNIPQYDKAFLNQQTISGRYPKGLIRAPMLSVIYPITQSMQMQGYIILMTPIQTIEEQTTQILNTIIICYIITLCLTALVLVYLHHQTVRPLKKMTVAAREYADGHFDYPMVKMNGQDQAALASAIWYLAEKMQTMNDYQKQFLANVSHDFRSPLTSIKGYTEAIADGTIPPEMQAKYLDIILFEVDRLHKLTNQLLELNQFDSNGMMIELSSFDINTVIKETVETFETQCEKKQLSVDLILDTQTIYVDADLPKIQRVIQNLLDNAIKFSKSGSTIEIHTTEQQKKCFISVKDHGIGIPR